MMSLFQVLHYVRDIIHLIKADLGHYFPGMPILCAFVIVSGGIQVYHNIFSHSHLTPNLVVLPHLEHMLSGW
jgi:hypothetical protein